MIHTASGHSETLPLFPVRPPETVSMRARDGVRLEADVYRPDAAGAWPVLLLRVACGRRTAQASHYAHPRWYAARGYVVVVQDVRGCGTSEGRFRPFEAERDDGTDAVAWAATLPGSSGAVGMYGCGYSGMAQLLALTGEAEALKALVPALAGWDVFSDWAYEGGAFRLAEAMDWALRCGAEAARRVEDGAGYRALLDAVRNLPLKDEIPSRPRVLRDYARYTHYDDWLTTPGPGGNWDGLSPSGRLRGAPSGVPVLQIGGWFDGRLAGTFDAHQALDVTPGAPARLVVGPWRAEGWHLPAVPPDLMPEEQPSIDALQLAWFDRFLKGIENGADGEAPVRLYDLTARRWRDLPGLPEANGSLHLHGDGLAATHGSGGRLASEPPAFFVVEALVHDPRLPVPALGGHTTSQPGSPAGLQDRAALDARPDVACYDTAPLTDRMTLAGRVALELSVEADAPSFDVSAVLSLVRTDGRVLPLTRGHARVEPGAPTRPLPIPMRAVCATLEPGERLRLSIAGSCFPAYPVNPGTGAEPGETRLVDALPITLLIHTGGPRPSRLHLASAEG